MITHLSYMFNLKNLKSKCRLQRENGINVVVIIEVVLSGCTLCQLIHNGNINYFVVLHKMLIFLIAGILN